eukprot:TRINITY_DN11331_c0_g1_i1.p1 TRINITY_DN11331_c0_g1~~TRINITY_DN11331_c0_g1_i1.p1  ORF type:complete len:316 (-),score=48.32 TRINITY_DN11331_c0_g1_i1:54-1001(-)
MVDALQPGGLTFAIPRGIGAAASRRVDSAPTVAAPPQRQAEAPTPEEKSPQRFGSGLVSGSLCTSLLTAAAAVAVRGHRRSRGLQAPTARSAESASDKLFLDSLSKEVSKLNQGKTRSADRSLSDAWRQRTRRQQRQWKAPTLRLSSGSNEPLGARILGAVCFIPALVVSIPFGIGIIKQVPLLQTMLVRPLLPLLRIYLSNRYAGFFCFMLMCIGIVNNKSLRPFTRTLGMQAVTLLMALLIPVNILMQFILPMPAAVVNAASGGIFFYTLYCAAMGVLGAASGEARDLPLIGDGRAPFAMRGGPSSMRFRGGG